MTKEEFLRRMQFPQEWLIWDMYPAELFEIQISGYEPAHEMASEHDRNGAFHWWIRQNPTRDKITNLIRLAFLDPDELMGNDVLRYLKRCSSFDEVHQDLVDMLAQQKSQES